MILLIFSFITEGVIEYEDQKYESNGDLTVWDAFKIGVKGANNMIFLVWFGENQKTQRIHDNNWIGSKWVEEPA